MGKVFFTKKQKAQMKERRKKKKLQAQPENGSGKKDGDNHAEQATLVDNSEEDHVSKATTKKRPRVDDDGADPTISVPADSKKNSVELTTKKIARTLYVLIPGDISSKDAKKFRKDARREIRHSKKINYNEDDYDEIEFVTQEDMPSIMQPSKKKRKQKEYPSIKELLKQKHQIEEIQKEESKLQEKLNAIPEAVRAKYVALDCEMVGIGTDGKKSALARVSIVDWNLDVVLDTFVQVPVRVTDFRTHVSGVEAKHIKSHNNAMPVKECRDKVAEILKGKILVGHALTNDFKALMTSHPKDLIRDTAKYRPFQRYGNGKWRARKLRDLVKENLKGKDSFQSGEHDSVQDAMATMELFQVVFSQWEKELESKKK
jgi:RNA exonuclease 4